MKIVHRLFKLRNSMFSPYRETLYNNIGILGSRVVAFSALPACRLVPTDPPQHTLAGRAARRGHAPHDASSLVSYARGKVSHSAAACCLPARCSQSRWGPCCV